MPTIEIRSMCVDHRVRRKPQRLTSNGPIETARRNYSDCPSSRAGSPDRNLTFSGTNLPPAVIPSSIRVRSLLGPQSGGKARDSGRNPDSAVSICDRQRTREFGIKMMLGATRQSIYRYAMKRGLRQVALGVLIGLALAMPAAWAWMRIDAFDGSVHAKSALILLIVSLTATGLPAYRATEVDPIQALRDQ